MGFQLACIALYVRLPTYGWETCILPNVSKVSCGFPAQSQLKHWIWLAPMDRFLRWARVESSAISRGGGPTVPNGHSTHGLGFRMDCTPVMRRYLHICVTCMRWAG